MRLDVERQLARLGRFQDCFDQPHRRGIVLHTPADMQGTLMKPESSIFAANGIGSAGTLTRPFPAPAGQPLAGVHGLFAQMVGRPAVPS